MTPEGVLKSRIAVLQRVRKDVTGKFLKGLKAYYKTRPAEFITDWMITYDPRVTKTPLLPFTLFPKQVELVNWIQDRVEKKEDGIIEKTRDFGVSYIAIAWAVHALIFKPGLKVGIGSRKEKLVDEIGNPDSLFEKARLILEYLPAEFRPPYLSLSHMRIVNRATNSSITGEAGDNIGRGGRNTVYFKDESAFYERPQKIEAALSMNSDVKIDISTPNGAGNPFFLKRMSKKFEVFICDWRDDPRKNQAWYEKQLDLFDPWIVAQEIDRDYYASIEGICIPAKYVRAAIDFPLAAEGAKKAGLDIADEGKDANALCLRHGSVITKIDSWKVGTTTETARKAYSICKARGVESLTYESNGVGAGVKGEMRSIKEKEESDYKLHVAGINPGSPDLPGIWAEGKLEKDMFVNIRAKLWWTLRRRFKRTYQKRTGARNWPDDKCISIPNNHQLILELSQPKISQNDAGKLLVESKKAMAKRGVKSGNLADCLMLSEHKPTRVFAA